MSLFCFPGGVSPVRIGAVRFPGSAFRGEAGITTSSCLGRNFQNHVVLCWLLVLAVAAALLESAAPLACFEASTCLARAGALRALSRI